MFILMHDLPHLPYYISAPMALMDRHVNEWHGIKARN